MRSPLIALVLSMEMVSLSAVPVRAAEMAQHSSNSTAASTFVDSDKRWSDRFHPNGPLALFSGVAVSGDDVYVSGPVVESGLPPNSIAKWDGHQWTALGIATYGPNYSDTVLTTIGTDLYAAGGFLSIDGLEASRVAKWDGHTWSPLGAGLNGNVFALTSLHGELYAGGEFTASGELAVSSVARWDGHSWSALGSGPPGAVRSFAVIGQTLYAASNGAVVEWNGTSWSPVGALGASIDTIAAVGTDLYAGGGIEYGSSFASYVARWDGQTWTPLTTGLRHDVDWYVTTLAVVGTTLYAAEDAFDWYTGKYSARVTRLDGDQWTLVADDFDEGVFALVPDGNDLVVGGLFNAVAGVATGRLARLSGQVWSAIGDDGGLAPSDAVWALLVYKDELYAGGAFKIAGNKVVDGLARWDGKKWSPVGGGVHGVVFTLATDGTDLYVGGGFSRVGDTEALSIAKWDGTSWSALGGGVDSAVRAITFWNGDLYAGGYFDNADGKPAPSVAKWNGSEWSALGDGIQGTVYALAATADGLYVGGELIFSGIPELVHTRLGLWDGTAWKSAGLDIGNPVTAMTVSGENLYLGDESGNVSKLDGAQWADVGAPNGPGGSSIRAIAVAGPDLYIAGGFSIPGLTHGVARWNGSEWSSLGSGVTGGALALSVTDSNLFLGGYLTSAGGKPSAYLADYRFDVCGDVNGDASITAVDALSVLRASVQIVPCKLSVCDFNGDSQISASDALATLRVAVGLAGIGECGAV